MWTREHLKLFSTWRHTVTGSYYTVIGIGTCSTNGDREHKEESVVYVSHSHQHLCYREINEFLDGRFHPITFSQET
jgi:hypothetical protein